MTEVLVAVLALSGVVFTAVLANRVSNKGEAVVSPKSDVLACLVSETIDQAHSLRREIAARDELLSKYRPCPNCGHFTIEPFDNR